MENSLLKDEEIAVRKLRAIYEQYGYKPYKMSKFEEFELYVANKDFLVSDRVITFNDTNGKLLALKPDVTLSIIKNIQGDSGKQKLYYNENVYRVSQSTNCFKEIMQSGLECIGNIDIYDIYEVITIAAKSLNSVSSDFVLEISNLSFVESAIYEASKDQSFKEQAFKYIESKNSHDLIRLCDEYSVNEKSKEKLLTLINAYGDRSEVIKTLKEVFNENDIKDIILLSLVLDKFDLSKNIIFDFSVAGNTNFYNGFIFKGFIKGINDRVLAGGQYDKMMQKMSKKMGAIGFAIYLDLLEELAMPNNNKSIDCLILYDDNTNIFDVINKSNDLVNAGKSISVIKGSPENIKFKEIMDMRGNKNA